MSLFFLSIRGEKKREKLHTVLCSRNFLSEVGSDGERNTDLGTGGGRSADPPHQPDVHHVPSLYEEKI